MTGTGPLARMGQALRRPPLFYLLLQIPGALVAGVVLVMAVEARWLAPGTAVAAFVAWVAKDVALYPLYRPALTRVTPVGAADALHGCRGRARTAVAERGLVVIQGEFWRACAQDAPIPAGAPVRVVASSGRLLTVIPDAVADGTEGARL